MPMKSTSKLQPYTGGYCGQDSHASFVNPPLNPVAEAMLDQTKTPTLAAAAVAVSLAPTSSPCGGRSPSTGLCSH